jgi:hypothetical protein
MPWPGLPGAAAALGITLAFLSAGLVLAITIVPAVKTELSLRDELRWSRPATLLAALTPAILPTVVVFLAVWAAEGWRSPWILTFPLAAFLVVAGRELGGLMAFLPIQLARIVGHITALIDVLISGIFWILFGILTLLKAAFSMVAAPVLSVWPLPQRRVDVAPMVPSSPLH